MRSDCVDVVPTALGPADWALVAAPSMLAAVSAVIEFAFNRAAFRLSRRVR
jgi:hypothetical protein